jgi:hypothetical protein
MKTHITLLAITLLVALSCKNKSENKINSEDMYETTSPTEGSFSADVEFLKKWDPNLIVLKANNSNVAVSSKYQAKVFTSTASGGEGKSMGWINYKAFGKEDPHMNAYGGENRFWLGPEGNTFSLFFKPGDEMVFENWKTPSPIDTEAWEMTMGNDTSVTMESKMSIRNYADSELKMHTKRIVSLLTDAQIREDLGIEIEGVNAVAYTTENSITNTGEFPWTKDTGAPCIWILDMFSPSEETTVFIPYKNDAEGIVATTDYFGEIPQDRILYEKGKLFFKADGRLRGKLGISPNRATNMAGSYDAVNAILTITVFDIDPKATYLNQEWNLDANPYQGDVINAYNDGPLEDGSQMGPFYELESVSPAAFLAPNETLSHTHTVFHFTGDTARLNQIVEKVFGMNIKEITNALH